MFIHLLLVSSISFILVNAEANSRLHHSKSETMKKLMNRETFINGPNCWNSVLYISGIASHIRFSSENELSFWTKTKYCQKISVNQQLKTGDTVIIRNIDGITHSMIWTNKDNFFSKTTSRKGDAYEIIKADLIFSVFRVDDQQCRNLSDNSNKNCLNWIEAFRCTTISSDQVKLENESLAYKSILESVNTISEKIHFFSFDKSTNNEELEKDCLNFEKKLNRIEEATKVEIKKLNNRQIFKSTLWQGLLHSVVSLKKQMEIIKNQLKISQQK